jgi:hypothetical protein
MIQLSKNYDSLGGRLAVSSSVNRLSMRRAASCYNPANRHQRQETERFHSFGYEELLKRDKLSLDLFWLRDVSLEDADGLPEPDVLARSIVENLQAALAQIAAIASDLGNDSAVLEALDDRPKRVSVRWQTPQMSRTKVSSTVY